MIYVSTQALATASRQSVMETQSELARTQQELTSGTLADAGLTLGARSGQLVELDGERTRLQGRKDVNAQTTTRLTATSTVLDTLRTSAQGMLSALTAATASGSADTAALQTTAQNALGAFTSAMNTAVAGQYIFGGINSGVAPLAGYSSTSPSKAAVDAAFSAAFGTGQTSAAASSIGGSAMSTFLDGSFASLFDPSGYSATWSAASDQTIMSQISSTDTINGSVSANDPAFRQLAQAYTMVSEFGSSPLNSAAISAVIGKATTLVTSALKGMTATEAGVGLSTSAVKAASTSIDSQISLLSSRSNDLDGVDDYALSTRLSVLQAQLQASYELTSKLQNMSLTQFLS